MQKKFIKSLVILFVGLNTILNAALPTLAIVPFGDSKNIGRSLQGGYERTASHLLAQELKKELEAQGICTVLITHTTQETLAPYHIASLVNQRSVTAVIILECHTSKIPGLECDVFWRCTNKLITANPYQGIPLAITPTDQSNLAHIDESRHLCDTVVRILSNETNKKTFRCELPLGIPLIALEGINAPSLLVDCGYQEFSDGARFKDPLVEGIRQYFMSHRS